MEVNASCDNSVVLRSGNRMPLLGFGTYQIPETSEGSAAVLEAIRAGYRLLDCASFYQNQLSVGRVISAVDRRDLYVVSKVWNDAVYAGPAAVRASCIKSIDELQCGYLDLLLIHWPVPGKHVEAYKELIRLQSEGLVRDIGVSNYTIEDYQQLVAAGVSVLPSVNQIEINPYLFRKKTIEYFRSQGVVPMSYRGLRSAHGLDDPILMEIAKNQGVTVAQVLGRWLIQHNICHIPKSIKADRIVSNGDIFSFKLSKEEMFILDNLTTPAALSRFRSKYFPRIFRDTPLPITEFPITIE